MFGQCWDMLWQMGSGKCTGPNAQANANSLISGKKKSCQCRLRKKVLSLFAKGWKTQLLPEHHRCKRDREQSPWYLLSCCRAEPLTSPQLLRGLLTLQVFDFERLERTLVLTTRSRSNVALMGWLPQRERLQQLREACMQRLRSQGNYWIMVIIGKK